MYISMLLQHYSTALYNLSEVNYRLQGIAAATATLAVPQPQSLLSASLHLSVSFSLSLSHALHGSFALVNNSD